MPPPQTTQPPRRFIPVSVVLPLTCFLQVFFYKAHIFAGQVQPAEKRITDFAWLTKEEIESYVDKDYWEGTKDMLADF